MTDAQNGPSVQFSTISRTYHPYSPCTSEHRPPPVPTSHAPCRALKPLASGWTSDVNADRVCRHRSRRDVPRTDQDSPRCILSRRTPVSHRAVLLGPLLRSPLTGLIPASYRPRITMHTAHSHSTSVSRASSSCATTRQTRRTGPNTLPPMHTETYTLTRAQWRG